jgi:hypothetical protein
VNDALLVLILFALAVSQEVAYVKWTLAAVAGSAWTAAGFSGAIQLSALVSVLLVVQHPLFLLATVVGHAAGSLVSVGRKQ